MAPASQNPYQIQASQQIRTNFEEQAPLAAKEPATILTTCLLDVRRGLYWASTPIGQPMANEPTPDFKQFILAPKEYALSFLEDKATLEGWEFWIDQRLCKGLRALKIYSPTHKVSEVYTTFLCGITESQGPRMSDYDLELCNQIKKRKEAILMENLKIKYSIPVDCERLQVQIQQFRSLTVFIFGNESPILLAIDPWLNLFSRRSSVMRDAIRRDKTTGAKILTVIDTSIQNFLSSCRTAKSQGEIDYDCLSPRDEIKKVMNNRSLDVVIPSTLESLLDLEMDTPIVSKSFSFTTHEPSHAVNSSGTPNNTRFKKNDNKQEQPAKKQKSDNNNKTFLKNDHANQELMDKFATDKNHYHSQTNDLLMINNTQLCVKFHLMGGCSFGKACTRARSHTVLSKRQESDLKSWLEKHERKDKE
jgi:hypothetical protein